MAIKYRTACILAVALAACAPVLTGAQDSVHPASAAAAPSQSSRPAVDQAGRRAPKQPLASNATAPAPANQTAAPERRTPRQPAAGNAAAPAPANQTAAPARRTPRQPAAGNTTVPAPANQTAAPAPERRAPRQPSASNTTAPAPANQTAATARRAPRQPSAGNTTASAPANQTAAPAPERRTPRQPSAGNTTLPAPANQTSTPARRAPRQPAAGNTTAPAPANQTAAPERRAPRQPRNETAAAPTTPAPAFDPLPSTCDMAASPETCQKCMHKVMRGVAHPDAAAMQVLTEPACATCASLPSKALRDYCINCVSTYGPSKGCGACAAGKLLGAIVSGKEVQTDSNGIANVAQCLACYNKANSKLESIPTCAVCWHGPDIQERAACGDCVRSAATDKQANVCTACAGRDPIASQKSCYECISKTPDWDVKPACAVAPARNQDLRVARMVLPDYFSCLKAAYSKVAADLCKSCIAVKNDAGRSRGCFKCVGDLLPQELSKADLSIRGSLCALM